MNVFFLVNAIATKTAPQTARVNFVVDGQVQDANFVEVTMNGDKIEDSGLLAWDGSEGAVADDDGYDFALWLAEPVQSDKCLEPVTLSGWYKTELGNFRRYDWLNGQLVEGQTVTAAQLSKIEEDQEARINNPLGEM